MIGLEEIIKEQNIKVGELAEQIEVRKENIWDWIRNKVPKNKLEKVARVLNVDKEYLNKQVNDIDTYQPRRKGFNDYEIRGDITAIIIINRKGERFEALIDTEDLQKLIDLNYSWHVQWFDSTQSYYVASTVYENGEYGRGKGKTIQLQCIIMDAPIVDHIISSKTLDNRKSNLRKSDKETNATNRKGKNKNNKSGYRNVFWSTKDNRWLVTLQIDGRQKCFGRFKYEDVDKAGVLAEEMRQKYYKDFAGKN